MVNDFPGIQSPNWIVCEGRAGIPMEVMGLMLGQFVDDYTITCVDVFAMPQVVLLSVYLYYAVFFINKLARHGGQCWGCRSGFSNKYAGYAQADRTSRNGCRLVPFSSWIRLLAIWSWYEYPTIVRATKFSSGKLYYKIIAAHSIGSRLLLSSILYKAWKERLW